MGFFKDEVVGSKGWPTKRATSKRQTTKATSKKCSLFVCHLVDLLLHHMSTAVNQDSFEDSDFLSSFFNVGCQLEDNRTEGSW
jgi:hypothetical protein